MRIIQYELNEVPWKVVDFYLSYKPKSNLGKILEHSISLTTRTYDDGELHPWSTWPTLHRGVYNQEHHIRFINQEIDSKFEPIWQILKNNGKTVGVFGSLQSYPFLSEAYAFYIPDTFAPDEKTWPSKYEVFQRFNLRQTQKDGALAKKIDFSPSLVREVKELYNGGLKITTLFHLASQLLKEKINYQYRSWRPILQAPVAFDFFWDAYSRSKPEFCTFFTNHVAGMMHRYWKYAFPEDFGISICTKNEKIMKQGLLFAMDVVDAQLGKLAVEADKNNTLLLICASMGQEKIDRGEYYGEFRIVRAEEFIKSIGFTGKSELKLAMQPDFVFIFPSVAEKSDFRQRCESLKDKTGNPIFTFKETEKTLNLNLKPSKECLKSEIIHQFNGTLSKPIPIRELGIEKIWRDPGTGYHVPEGIAIFYHKSLKSAGNRSVVESAQITPTILELFKASRGKYMKPPIDQVLKAVNI